VGRPHPALLDVAAGRPLHDLAEPEALITSAAEHRMLGLLHEAVAGAGTGFPQRLAAGLAQNRLAIRVSNQMLWRELARIASLAAGHGIDLAAFKGVTNEARWYPGQGLRPCADIDVFVAPHHLDRIGDLVKLLQPDHPVAGTIQAMIDGGAVQGVDLHLPNGTAVDLHQEPIKLGIPVRQLDEMWATTSTIAAPDGTEIRVLSPEIALVQALLHLQKDRFSYLLGFVDVARMISGSAIDWDTVDRFVHGEGLSLHTYESLRVVASWIDLDAPIPRSGRLAHRLWQVAWPPSSRLQGHVGMSRMVRTRYWIPFTMTGRRWEAFRWWWRIIFPPRRMVAYLHPDTRGPYLWRLVSFRTRLAWERHGRNRDQRRRGEAFRWRRRRDESGAGDDSGEE
jgi:hypothetical protein